MAEIEALKKRGITKPIIATPMERFLPPLSGKFNDTKHETESDDMDQAKEVRDELRKVMGISVSKSKQLSFLNWLAAYDHFMVTACVTGQLTLAAALAHRSNCIRVAQLAVKEKRRHPLAVCYDEVVRQTWAWRSFHNDPEFDVEKAVNKLDKEALDDARDLFDNSSVSASKGSGKGNFNQQANHENKSWGKRFQSGAQNGNSSKRARY